MDPPTFATIIGKKSQLIMGNQDDLFLLWKFSDLWINWFIVVHPFHHAVFHWCPQRQKHPCVILDNIIMLMPIDIHPIGGLSISVLHGMHPVLVFEGSIQSSSNPNFWVNCELTSSLILVKWHELWTEPVQPAEPVQDWTGSKKRGFIYITLSHQIQMHPLWKHHQNTSTSHLGPPIPQTPLQ